MFEIWYCLKITIDIRKLLWDKIDTPFEQFIFVG